MIFELLAAGSPLDHVTDKTVYGEVTLHMVSLLVAGLSAEPACSVRLPCVE